MEIPQTLVQVLVILGFGLWAYSKVTRQSINETIQEIKELINKMRGIE